MHIHKLSFGWIGALAVSAFAAGCATSNNARVIHRDSGAEAVAVGDNEKDATKQALDKAEDYCDDHGQVAVFPDNQDLSGNPSTRDKILSKLPGAKEVFGTDEGTQVSIRFNCANEKKS